MTPNSTPDELTGDPLSYSGCLGHYQNILDRRSTWIMANRHFGKIAESGSMPRWPRCWSESLQAGYAETT